MGSIIAWGFLLNFGYNFTLYAATALYGCAFLIMVLKPSVANRQRTLILLRGLWQ